jgi:predicted RNase H-like nuclease (RuvC/YqgF family)
VDSALWVLYRELESATSLRERVAELEAEIVKLRQDVSIRDNQLILSRRACQGDHLSKSEIDGLRAQAANGERAGRDLEILKARNAALEKELQDAKAETAAMTEILNEWKGKLVNMLGN